MIRHFLLLISLATTIALAEPPRKAPVHGHDDKTAVPRMPVAGQPFDDGEMARYLEIEGRKLFAAGKVKPLGAAVARRCSLRLNDAATEKLPLPEAAKRTEAATVVLGEFFKDKKQILDRIQPLFNVGLGYVKLGQSSDTLSGGEAQRVKLASFLGKGKTQGSILFIFDEPTTGLHFHDIKKLLASFNALIEQGHTILVIEHNTDVIKSADWVIDLGPEAGDAGGNLVFAGKPADLKKCKESYTGKFMV